VCLQAPWPAALDSIGGKAQTKHAWWLWLYIWAKFEWSVFLNGRRVAKDLENASLRPRRRTNYKKAPQKRRITTHTRKKCKKDPAQSDKHDQVLLASTSPPTESLRQRPSHHRRGTEPLGAIPGHIFGPGRARKKPDAKNAGPGLAQPDCQAGNLSPGPARGVFFLSGCRAGPS
jgi:hypothetical protein